MVIFHGYVSHNQRVLVNSYDFSLLFGLPTALQSPKISQTPGSSRKPYGGWTARWIVPLPWPASVPKADPMGKDMGKAMEYEDRNTKYNGIMIIWDHMGYKFDIMESFDINANPFGAYHGSIFHGR